MSEEEEEEDLFAKKAGSRKGFCPSTLATIHIIDINQSISQSINQYIYFRQQGP